MAKIKTSLYIVSARRLAIISLAMGDSATTNGRVDRVLGDANIEQEMGVQIRGEAL